MQLADQIVEAAAVTRHPDRYTAWFSRARSEAGHAICLCGTDQVVRLVICCRSARYRLAVWPDGGHR